MKRYQGIAVTVLLLIVILSSRHLRFETKNVYEPVAERRPPKSVSLKFREEGVKRGIDFHHQFYFPNRQVKKFLPIFAVQPAMAVADVNGDGFMDIYVVQPTPGQANRLYLNENGTTFREAAREWGVDDSDKLWPDGMALWGSFLGNVGLDLFISRFGCHTLFVLDRPGHYTQRPGALNHYCSNPRAVNTGDLDGDGRLDLIFGNFFPERSIKTMALLDLFERNGQQGGKGNVLFGSEAGFNTNKNFDLGTLKSKQVRTNAVGIADINNDGWPDLYFSNEHTFDRLFFNNRGRGLAERADLLPGNEHGFTSMNADFADLNNDGQLSLYVSNGYRPPYWSAKNVLWEKSVSGAFQNNSLSRGVGRCGWSWGAKFADFDNDGRLDLFVSNGKAHGSKVGNVTEATRTYDFILASISSIPLFLRNNFGLIPDFSNYHISSFQRSCLFWNQGEQFEDVAIAAGVNDLEDGQSIALIDFDNDGKMDVLVGSHGGPLLLYHNISQDSGQWIGLNLTGKKGMQIPFGARVSLLKNGIASMIREVSPANGFRGQSDPRIHFGLGPRTEPADIEVRWPNQRVERFYNLALNRYHDIRQRGGVNP